jgi:osmoprotectant transport system substrate-binding protein
MRKLLIVFMALALGSVIMATSQARAERSVTVGNKNFTEQYLVGQLMKQLLGAEGFKVDLKSDLTSMALRAGMESGDIDICADYTGTAWMIYLKRKYEPGTENNELYRMVKAQEVRNNFIWLSPMWNNNTYAMACWAEFARKYDITMLSDLARLYREKDGKITTFVDFEFSTRPDGLPALEKFYSFKIAKGELKTGTPGASLIGLKEHKAEIAMVFGTDASIAKYSWHVFADDKSFFPPYDLTPYVRKQVLDNYPEIQDILFRLADTFPGGADTPTPEIVTQCQKAWQKLNAKVDVQKKEPTEVAHRYLVENGLIEK